jgi:hypothetical protein
MKDFEKRGGELDGKADNKQLFEELQKLALQMVDEAKRLDKIPGVQEVLAGIQ